MALVKLLEESLARIEAGEKQSVRHYAELERRLLVIENSRFLRSLQWPGRFLGDWKGRLGQLLLHSPFHPIYLKLVNPHFTADRYRLWVESEQAPGERRLSRQRLISVVLPVHNPQRNWLEAAVASVLAQTYGCWQLCVCDDASEQGWVAEYFIALSATEPRIRFVRSDARLGIAGALNRAGELASGEYAGFLDQDDVLAPFAIECVAQAVQDANPDLLYSDEDYLDNQGRRVQPIFKPAFSPDLLRCGMYLGHLLVVRTAVLRELDWFRTGYDGSQDYDLALRIAARTPAVRHIPRVLYHWRQHPDSTALDAAAKPYTQAAGLKALPKPWRSAIRAGGGDGRRFSKYLSRAVAGARDAAGEPDHLLAQCETAGAMSGGDREWYIPHRAGDWSWCSTAPAMWRLWTACWKLVIACAFLTQALSISRP